MPPKKPTKKPTKTNKTPTPRTPKTLQIIKIAQEHPDLTTRQIGTLAECSHVNVVETLKRYGISKPHLDNYKEHKADIIAGLQHRIASSITDKDIQKSPMGSRVLAMAQLIDKEQLLRGLATSNLAVIHADIAALRAVDNSK
jgi:hypothetical protein